MFEHLVDFSLKNKAAVLALTAVVAVWGWLSFRDLTVEAFPDPTDTQVQVITLYPGQPAEEVERQIGLPLERALNGTPELSRLRNLSLFGLSYVTLTFNDGVDGLWARQQVLERLRDGRAARRHRPAARAVRHAHRRGVPLHAGGRGRRPDEAPHPSGLGGAPRPPPGERGGRRGELRRAAAGDPRPARPARGWRRFGLTLADARAGHQGRLA